jgi:predicted DCC family thiol-disulfide oxidoreductase YuxK
MPLMARLLAIVRAGFDARTIALTRIAVGIAAAGQGLRTWRMLTQLYSPEIARARIIPGVPELTVDFILPFAACWLLASLSFAAGFQTTIAGIVLAALMAYQLLLDLNLYSNHVYLLLLCTTLLTIARSGSALSADSWLRRGAADSVPYAPVFLLRFQLTAVYFFTAIQKINSAFLSGRVLQWVLFFGSADADPTLYQVLAVVVIATELFLAFALWVPSLRPWAFAVGAGLHLSLPIIIPSEWMDLVVFSVLTLGLYFTFFPSPVPRFTVIWDDYCSFCAGWIRVLRALDWLHVMDLVGSSDKGALARFGVTQDAADEEIKVIVDGAIFGGYDGIVRLTHALPPTVFIAPLLGLRPVRAVGRRLYRRVAARRKCTYVPSPMRIPSAGRRRQT